MQIKSMPKDGDKPNPRRAVSIMSSEDAKSGKKSHWEELEIKGPVRNLSPAIWQLSHLTALFLNDNQLQRIPPDISRLRNLFLLDLSSNKLRSLPAELGDLYNLRELHLNNNCLRALPYELGKLFQLHCLGLIGNPLLPDIMNMYNKGMSRLLTYFLDNLAMTTPDPPDRQYIKSGDPEPTPHTAIISVLSYNILCDKYATRQMYGYCPPWALNWEYRRKIITGEILHYGADIISLQEVETCEYNNFFVRELEMHGYEGVFSPKSRAKHMIEDDRQHVDGCAIFWKTSKFSLVKEHLIEFNQIAMQNNEGSEDMLNRVTTKDNIGLAVLLEVNEGLYENQSGFHQVEAPPKQHILAATAHMHWDPEFSDVKLIQTVILCHELKRICDESIQSFRNPHGITTGGISTPELDNLPMIMCGDLNSLPESGVVEYLTTGKVSTSHEDFRDLKYTKSLSNFSHRLRCGIGQDDPTIITHPFKLNSAYDNSTLHCLEYSNNTFEFKGIIDYIFYTRSQLKNLTVLGGIDSNWFLQNNVLGCPHPHIPSDHIPLLAEFQLLPPDYRPSSPPHSSSMFHQQQHLQLRHHSQQPGNMSPSYPHHLNNHVPFHHGMTNGFHHPLPNTAHRSRGFGPRRSSPISTTNSNSTPPMSSLGGMGSFGMSAANGRR